MKLITTASVAAQFPKNPPAIRCHECGASGLPAAVVVGEPPDYESSTATLCRACIVAALALLP